MTLKAIWDLISTLPIEVANYVENLHEEVKTAYTVSDTLGITLKSDLKLPNPQDFIKKTLETFGTQVQLPLFGTVTGEIKGASLRVIDKPYKKIQPRLQHRVKLDKDAVFYMDKVLSDKQVDVNNDGTADIKDSFFRIDSDDKPETFYFHFNLPTISVVEPGHASIELSATLYIVPSESPNKTIEINLPIKIDTVYQSPGRQ